MREDSDSGFVLWSRGTDQRSGCISAVGDIGFSGKTASTSPSLRAIFSKTIQGCLLFGNLETPLLDIWHPGQQFAGSIASIKELQSTKKIILHLANNHIYDYGPGGMVSTLAACQKAGIFALGAGEDKAKASSLVRTDIEDLRIGWLGCGRTLQAQNPNGPNFWEFNENELLLSVKSARSQVDILVVSLHIGLMFLDYPDPQHRKFAHQLIRAGANLILMHHAHVLQGIEVLDGGVICYNLGNFLLDWTEGNVRARILEKEQTEGGIFTFGLDDAGVCSVSIVPTFIDEKFNVRIACGERRKEIIERLIRISMDLETNYVKAFERQRVERNTGLAVEVLIFHAKKRNWGHLFKELRRMRLQHLKIFFRWLRNATFP